MARGPEHASHRQGGRGSDEMSWAANAKGFVRWVVLPRAATDDSKIPQFLIPDQKLLQLIF